MQDWDIPLENLIGYMSDNANVIVGQHNSVLSRVHEQQPNVYHLGCVYHIANTRVQHALKKMTSGVVDTFYYFLHCSKRKEEYQGFVDFVELEDPGKLLKPCPTRWLSLHKCVKRSLVHWPALKSYFDSQPEVEKKGSCVQWCAFKIHDEVLYMTYLFLNYILEPIIDFNTTFQANEAMVGYLHPEIKRFFKTMLSKFVKIRVITSATNVTKVDFKNPDNQHDDDNLAVGMGVRQYLSSNPDINSKAVETFFNCTTQFRDLLQVWQVRRWKTNFKTCLAEENELPTFNYGMTSMDSYWHDIYKTTNSHWTETLSQPMCTGIRLPFPTTQ
ncbi:uncharacterized protein LOC123525435 [Mercenaria mercenaria]|uniref:uncharacterized protein LOC123525435 n=1 Tax=Mercenaria mercenaria TaxID=6596 RepID=UPI00234F2D36|nr:uncharacterized protein LOC123525435 [Mercenaria mercenaria]